MLKIEFLVLFFSITGAIIFFYIGNSDPSFIRGGSLGGIYLGLCLLSWLISGPIFMINMFKKIHGFWYLRLAAILVCTFSYLDTASNM